MQLYTPFYHNQFLGHFRHPQKKPQPLVVIPNFPSTLIEEFLSFYYLYSFSWDNTISGKLVALNIDIYNENIMK